MTKLEIFKQEVMKVRTELLQIKEENENIIKDGAKTFSGAKMKLMCGETENQAILKAKLVDSIAKGSIANAVIKAVDRELEQIAEVLVEVTEEDI